MSFRPHYHQHHQQSYIDTSHCFPGCLQHSMVSDLTMVPIIGLPSRLWIRTQAWLYFPVCIYVCGAVPYHGAIHRSASTFVEPHPSMVSFFRSASTFVEPYPRIVPSIGHIDCQSFDFVNHHRMSTSSVVKTRNVINFGAGPRSDEWPRA